MQVQRATGALCTAAYEQTNPNSNGIDGNNAWNDAQGLAVSQQPTTVDILRQQTQDLLKMVTPYSMHTFDLINVIGEAGGSIHGFFWL